MSVRIEGTGNPRGHHDLRVVVTRKPPKSGVLSREGRERPKGGDKGEIEKIVVIRNTKPLRTQYEGLRTRSPDTVTEERCHRVNSYLLREVTCQSGSTRNT